MVKFPPFIRGRRSGWRVHPFTTSLWFKCPGQVTGHWKYLFQFLFHMYAWRRQCFYVFSIFCFGGKIAEHVVLKPSPQKTEFLHFVLTSLSKAFYSLSYTVPIPLKLEKNQRKAEIENKKDPLGISWEKNPLHIPHFLPVEKGCSLLGLPWISKSRHNSYKLGR